MYKSVEHLYCFGCIRQRRLISTNSRNFTTRARTLLVNSLMVGLDGKWLYVGFTTVECIGSEGSLKFQHAMPCTVNFIPDEVYKMIWECPSSKQHEMTSPDPMDTRIFADDRATESDLEPMQWISHQSLSPSASSALSGDQLHGKSFTAKSETTSLDKSATKSSSNILTKQASCCML
jgi:hypothetical protein